MPAEPAKPTPPFDAKVEKVPQLEVMDVVTTLGGGRDVGADGWKYTVVSIPGIASVIGHCTPEGPTVTVMTLVGDH